MTISRKRLSSGISRSHRCRDGEAEAARFCERLIDDAISFCELNELIDALLRLVRLQVEGQPYLTETDRRVLRHAERVL